MVLSEFNIIELSTALVSVFGACGMLLAVTQKSRCKRFKCCCGLIDCQREIADIENQVDMDDMENMEDDETTKTPVENKVISLPSVSQVANKLPKSVELNGVKIHK